LKDLGELVKGNTPQKMNEFEAAKMIGLGTIVGKFQQKALALKNFHRDEFTKVVQEFIEVLETIKPTIAALESNSSTSQKSTKCSLTFLDLLKDKTLIDGLRLLNSPYDLLETFPMVGIGFHMKRFEKVLDSAYCVKISKFPQLQESVFTKNVIDSVFMSENPDWIQTHEGMEVNCLLPLLDLNTDLEFCKIYETRLFKLLMTFNVTGNVDKIDDEAYLSL